MTTASELERMCREGQNVQLVDVRSTSEYATGHIPGTLNVPLEQLEAALTAERKTN